MAKTFSHEAIYTMATYSPWRDDVVFLDAYDRLTGYKNSTGDYVQSHRYSPALRTMPISSTWAEPSSFTLLDVSRAYSLWSYVRQTHRLAGADIIEIGGWRGGISALMARCCQQSASTSLVYCCDTYDRKCGMVNATEKDLYRNGALMNGHLPDVEDVERACACVGVAPVQVLSGVFPDDTGHLVHERRFRVCHIDVDVYVSAKDSFRFLWDRVVPGGVIVFDDYGFQDCPGLTEFVEEEFEGPDRIFTYNLNGQGVLTKLDQDTGM